ncbi:MAG: rRNA maturation RNase YbeY [Nitrospirae bacterium GWB2_47_37]|nr:MAG: rRNA maturation RNase YbeY [Nitrospirae bacterium GWA2_46_11]OGW23913.1 MAG: rRNA maturation RNase YbeY [Nitrospirae bacterium GWB2_47_37]HAK89285.1 rRNA maturation RNase YbeY [Nitrospiraceae bacterium]
METAIRNSQRRIRISRHKIENTLKQAAVRLSNNYPRRFGMLDTCEVSVLMINDRTMRELNRQYRGKDKTTDVLSFPQIERFKQLKQFERLFSIGDIVINLHKAERQAKEYGVTFHREVERLLIHGFLHLLGYDHEKSKYEARKMRKLEEELLGVNKLCR